jgi:muramoyltetrapeptide carboxypeptidase
VKHKNWQFLEAGDVIDVIAPGYPSPAEQVVGGGEFLRSWGLVPRIPKNLVQKHFLHANSDEKRFQFLKQALLSADSKAIWCTRGGYGSNRLLPYLAKMKPPKQMKVLVGLSDVTSLHTFFTQEWGWPSLHACVLDRIGRNDLPKPLVKELRQVLFGETDVLQFSKLKALNSAADKIKTSKASVVGGNLTVLQSSLGTPFQIETKGKFLFVEDIAERGYRIDRMFEQFRQAGLFQDCRGILLGHFIGGEEPATGKNNFKKVFSRWADDLNIPLFGGVEAGHGEWQRTLPFNTPAVLKKDYSGFSLLVETGGVKSK